MSKIPYYFETPIPIYFRENGWLVNINSLRFITWAFSRCSANERTIVHDHKELTLQPFEFITGRGKSSKDSRLSEDAFKHQLNAQLKAGLLKKTPNSTPNRFTCYIWVTTRFSEPNTQLNAQLTPKSRPTERPQSRREKNIRSKESHPSYLPSLDSGLTDDFLQKEISFEHTFRVNEKPLTISMPKSTFDECVAIKGSPEKVIEAIEFIMRSPGRKSTTHDWPNKMRTWNIKSCTKTRNKENQELAARLVSYYNDSSGYRCDLYKDSKKDQQGILFFSSLSVGNPETFFFDFDDPDFQDKCSKVIRDKKMQRSHIPN